MNTSRLAAVTSAVLLLAGMLVGCSGEAGGGGSAEKPSPAASPDESASPSASESPTPTPTPVAIPDDCRAILSDDVLAQLKDVPLNDPGVGPSGVQADGSLL